MNKVFKVALLIITVGLISFLAVKQYKFNCQLEYWTTHQNYSRADLYWETIIPAKAKAELATGEITKRQYQEWMYNIKKDQKKANNDWFNFISLNPEMPYTKDYDKFVEETKINSLSGYIHDLFHKPYNVDGEMFQEKVKKTIRLKNHWYGGSDGECFIAQRRQIKGHPLPLLSRYLYQLSCVNDKSKKEGLGGFDAVSSSDNMELL